MPDLWWEDEGQYVQLYAGCFESPIAWLYKSNKGKTFGAHFEIPIGIERKWANKDLMKSLVKGAAERFFGLALTSRPAMERPDA